MRSTSVQRYYSLGRKGQDMASQSCMMCQHGATMSSIRHTTTRNNNKSHLLFICLACPVAVLPQKRKSGDRSLVVTLVSTRKDVQLDFLAKQCTFSIKPYQLGLQVRAP